LAGNNRIGGFHEKKGCLSFAMAHFAGVLSVISANTVDSVNRKQVRSAMNRKRYRCGRRKNVAWSGGPCHAAIMLTCSPIQNVQPLVESRKMGRR
jgi:hypothetical protein